MANAGQKPKGKVGIKWSPDFSYGLGLLASDGNLSPDGRHISFVSKDFEQMHNFLKVFQIKDIKIGGTTSGYYKKIKVFRVQFGDVQFYKFLTSIGITVNKSKSIGIVNIPPPFQFDFLRGVFDGDGTFYSYWDKRWKSSHMFYIEFASASTMHIKWIRSLLKERLGIVGHITNSKEGGTYQLKYAKREALEIIKKMYYNARAVCLSRKKAKIFKALEVERLQQKQYGW
ncbi:MAG: LAGLIDADG family homing endonuclease [Candidatus Paceibacterota bacterium]